MVYDHYRQHFILAFASASSTQSFLSLVVIPEGSEGTTADWCVLHMSGDQVAGNGKQLADYPMVGFTEDRVTLTTNQFDYSDAPFAGGFRVRAGHLAPQDPALRLLGTGGPDQGLQPEPDG